MPFDRSSAYSNARSASLDRAMATPTTKPKATGWSSHSRNHLTIIWALLNLVIAAAPSSPGNRTTPVLPPVEERAELRAD